MKETNLTAKARKRRRRAGGIAAAVVIGGLAAGFAHAQTAQGSGVQTFGILTIGVDYVNNASSGGTSGSMFKLQNAQSFPNFFGFRGTEDLGGGTFASFSLATNVNLKNGVGGQGGSFWNKHAWVGIGSKTLGTLMIGRNDEFSVETCPISDMCWNDGIHSLAPGNLDRVGGAQLANMLKYTSPTFNDFALHTFYSFADSTAGTAGTNNGRAVGAEITYRTQPLAATLAYESINGIAVSPLNPAIGFGLSRFFGTTVTPGTAFVLDQENIATLSARYNAGRMSYTGKLSYVAMNLGPQTETARGYELAASYKLTDPLSLHLGCHHWSFNAASQNLCAGGAVYMLSKRTRVYVFDTYNRANGAGAVAQQFQNAPASGKSQNTISVGMRIML